MCLWPWVVYAFFILKINNNLLTPPQLTQSVSRALKKQTGRRRPFYRDSSYMVQSDTLLAPARQIPSPLLNFRKTSLLQVFCHRRTQLRTSHSYLLSKEECNNKSTLCVYIYIYISQNIVTSICICKRNICILKKKKNLNT